MADEVESGLAVLARMFMGVRRRCTRGARELLFRSGAVLSVCLLSVDDDVLQVCCLINTQALSRGKKGFPELYLAPTCRL